jgi:hypothetical protein
MGRNSLILVIAFNITFMMMGFRTSKVTSTAYEKYSSYAAIEQASLAVESGANIAISNAFFDPLSTIPNANISFPSPGKGTIQIIKTPILEAVSGFTLGYNLTVNGSCNIISGPGGNDAVTSQTSIQVQGNSFSQYVMYSVTENVGGTSDPIYWMDGEVCRGPLHTQDNLYINGDPRFEGKVTIFKKLQKESGSNPNFVLGYMEGVNITIPTDLNDLKTLGAAGANYTGVKVFVQFQADGKVTVKTTPATSTLDGWAQTGTGYSVGTIKACTTYASIAALTSSGVLLVNGSELHVKGVLNGRITLGAVGAGSIVMLDSSVVYQQPPPTSVSPANVSDDLLGIVSENDIRITDTAHPSKTSGSPNNYTPANNNNNNKTQGVTIDGSMFSQKGGFGAENYDTRGDCGIIRIHGGIQQQGRDPVGRTNGSDFDGFKKDYAFDNRLYTDRPIGYPTTPYLVQNWRDSTNIPNSFWE